MIARTKFKRFRPFENDTSAFPAPACHLGKGSQDLIVGLYALGRALSRAHHLRQSFGQGTGFNLHRCSGNIYPRRYRSAPQVNFRISARLHGEDRHPLGRTHRRGIKQKLLIEWKRVRRTPTAHISDSRIAAMVPRGSKRCCINCRRLAAQAHAQSAIGARRRRTPPPVARRSAFRPRRLSAAA